MPYANLLRGRWSSIGQVYLVSTTTHRRRRLFADFGLACIVARELVAMERAQCWRTSAWVIMPDHMHLLVTPAKAMLADAMQRLKGRSSRAIHAARDVRGPVWQHGYHEHGVRREESLRSIARYVCMNPVRAGLVRSLREYPFWDAQWLDGHGGDREPRRQAEA